MKRIFRKIDYSLQRQIKNKIEEVSENPERYKHLNHSLSGSCRIRIGKVRIIFSYDIIKQELYPEKIVFSHNY